ncbi:MAG TPA: hypothetical protein VF269_03265 [Rhodanobacteraceae bacterium]
MSAPNLDAHAGKHDFGVICARVRERVRDGTATLLHTHLPTSAAWVVFAIIMANVAAYILLFSDPIIVQDAWYFLDVFLSHAAHRTLDFSDFFIKRGSLDHSQPLRKFILLLNWRDFDLDFRIQAIVGLICAGGSLLLVRYLVIWRDTEHGNFKAWVWAAICAVLVSLNSTGVWTWPLVASGFTSYIFLFLLLVCIWNYIDSGLIALPVLSALMLDFVAGDVAILANIACILALLFVIVKSSTYRRKAIHVVILLVACILLVRLIYAIAFSVPHAHTLPFATRFSALLHEFVHGGWWQWILIPLGSSIAYLQPHRGLLGNDAAILQLALGVAVLVCHGLFWYAACRTKPNAATFSAIAMMLLFYGLLCGILYARIPVFGNNYLRQPRYVLMYGFQIVALLLMAAGFNWKGRLGIHARKVVAVLAVLFVLWQIPVSMRAWKAGPYIAAYERHLANQIWWMADHHYQVPPKCLPELFVCQYPIAKRAELIGLLEHQKKNVFSSRFQRNNRLYPPPSVETKPAN